MPGAGPLHTVYPGLCFLRYGREGAKQGSSLRAISWSYNGWTHTSVYFHLLIEMSLAALANGADCGPMNPLQGLTKNLDSDRGLQQVRAARLFS